MRLHGAIFPGRVRSRWGRNTRGGGQRKVWGKSAVAGQRARRGGGKNRRKKKFFLRLSCYVPSRAIKRGLLRDVGVSIQAVGKSKTWVDHPRLGDMERRVGRVGRVRDPGKMQFPLGMPLAYLAAAIFCRWHTSCQLLCCKSTVWGILSGGEAASRPSDPLLFSGLTQGLTQGFTLTPGSHPRPGSHPQVSPSFHYVLPLCLRHAKDSDIS